MFDEAEVIDFSDIAPPETVVRRVAAGAFYNVLSSYRLSFNSGRQAR